jgi:hypothetical protein
MSFNIPKSMERDIRKIFQRGVITLISILLMILLNFYFDKWYESTAIPNEKIQIEGGPVYTRSLVPLHEDTLSKFRHKAGLLTISPKASVTRKKSAIEPVMR